MTKIVITLSLLTFTVGLFAGSLLLSSYIVSEKRVLSILSSDETSRPDMMFFLNNNIKIILSLIFGSLTFSTLTVVILLYNGIISGIIIKTVAKQIGLTKSLFLILPHGIFEIPAIIIAGAAGFKIPYEIVRYLMGKKEQPLTKENIKEYLTLALISIILIVIAAFVEAYVTPRIAEYFLSKGI